MILDEFELPEKAKVNKIIPKKTIYENSELKKSEQELIKDSVEKIIWEYSLKESNINIDKYQLAKSVFELGTYLFTFRETDW